LIFPSMKPQLRKYGVKVWEEEGKYRFEAEGTLAGPFFAEIFKKDDKWHMNGGARGASVLNSRSTMSHHNGPS